MISGDNDMVRFSIWFKCFFKLEFNGCEVID